MDNAFTLALGLVAVGFGGWWVGQPDSLLRLVDSSLQGNLLGRSVAEWYLRRRERWLDSRGWARIIAIAAVLYGIGLIYSALTGWATPS